MLKCVVVQLMRVFIHFLRTSFEIFKKVFLFNATGRIFLSLDSAFLTPKKVNQNMHNGWNADISFY